jgi:hypothetical protein
MISPVVEYLCRWPHGVKFEEWVMQQRMMASAKNHTLGVVETIHPEDQAGSPAGEGQAGQDDMVGVDSSEINDFVITPQNSCVVF